MKKSSLEVLSCIIWTITLQTTIKYVFLVLKADNRGEGGTFALYALGQKAKKMAGYSGYDWWRCLACRWNYYAPISITSAVEGLKELPTFRQYWRICSLYCPGYSYLFFFLQQFGTASIGRLFGPIMFIWFSMLAVLGVVHLVRWFFYFPCINPYYAVEFLTHYPHALWFLGAVFFVQPAQKHCIVTWDIVAEETSVYPGFL